MRLSIFLIFFLLSISTIAQEGYQYLNGIVENDATGFPMESVHIINLNNVIGTTSDNKGVFEIPVQVNDTLYFSYLGYKSLKVAVTQDMIRFKSSKFQLTELAYALEEIILRPYLLTGYLDIDVKSVPINQAGRYRIAGLSNAGYEAGNRKPNSISKTFASRFSPQSIWKKKCSNEKIKENERKL